MNCKLVGQYIQTLEVTLEPNEEFYCEKGSLIYLENGIGKDRVLNGNSLGKLFGAKLSGESIFILRIFNMSPMTRKFCIGSNYGLLPIKLNGETLICRKGVYVASNNRVDIDTKLSIAGLTGGMGLVLQKIRGNSTVFLDTEGTPMTINLNVGETIEVDEDHIIAIQNIPENRLQANWSLGNLLGGEGLSMLMITGPGTVYLSPAKKTY